VDLFDTTPDICGQDLDVSRYIRDGEDSDVQFFWRDIATGRTPVAQEPQPLRGELCRVSLGDAAKFLKDGKKARAWCWNPLGREWETAKSARPGGVYLIAVESGGYNDALGWTGETKDKPTPHPPVAGDSEAHDGDPDTVSPSPQSIADHTALVVAATDALGAVLGLAAGDQAALYTAALWHDVGKAHGAFQAMLRNGDDSLAHTLWAKSASLDGKCPRRGFRHELASALAWLLAGQHDAPERDLVAYLIAAHHGKVRLSIRALPNEPAPDGADRLFARGVWHGDQLPSVPLGAITVPSVTLDLSFMQMGEGRHGPSWLARTIALRDRLGPFRLALLETLLRAADARASRQTQSD
jgi:CRISPR-associated endonuclease/helicase Cas3